MKNKTQLLLLAICAFSCMNTSEKHVPKGERLRTIVSEGYDNLLIGGTIDAWTFDSVTGKILDNEFAYVTPENDFKHRIIRNDSTNWDWTLADSWIQHIAEHDQVLRIHGPISPQCSGWVKDDAVSPQVLEKEMKLFMKELCQRYNGVDGVVMLDVVNETVHEGAWKKDEPGYGDWELPWYKIGQDNDELGTPLYIKYAFEVATQYAPDMKLIFNQHEHPDVYESWDMIKKTVAYLRSKDLRVDGLGWQAHLDDGWATEAHLTDLSNLIDWCFDNDLSFHVTEASVWVDSTNVNSTLETHAQTYGKVLQVILDKHKEGEITWNTWNVDDRFAWHADKLPTLFDDNFEPKPAYYEVQRVLEANRTK